MPWSNQEPAVPDNAPPLSVTELSLALKRAMESAFGWVRVRGELSGCKQASSGHWYMALKDDKSVLDAVCWRGQSAKLGIAPQDGLEVVATGRLTTYPGRSRYQIVLETLEPAGVGALLRLLEERRRRLAAEGLFDTARKRPLPYLPEVIGVVTSPTGAVIRDILHRLQDRFPRRVLLWAVPVQGEGAAARIAAAIRGFDALPATGPAPRPDVLIVARGGGSLEDLWAFNEEEVVRAVAACTIPMIAAVGHEVDTTLIDAVADRRAPTPTAAAEMAVPVRLELLETLRERTARLGVAASRLLLARRRHVEGLSHGLPRPEALLQGAMQRLDDLVERLENAWSGTLRQRRRDLTRLTPRLRAPAASLRLARERLDAVTRRLTLVTTTRLRRDQARLAALRPEERLHRRAQALARMRAERLRQLEIRLEGVSWRGALRRGYAVVRDADGAVVSAAASVRSGASLTLEFHDGISPLLRVEARR